MPMSARTPASAELRAAFASHEIREAPARAWRVAQPGTWNLGFYVSWCPGKITISGDLDTLTFEHYHAFNSPESAIAWLRGADFDYAMTKSDAAKVFDPEATAAQLLEFAREEAAEIALELKAERHARARLIDAAPYGAALAEARAELIAERDDLYPLFARLADLAFRRWTDPLTTSGRREIARALAMHLDEMGPDRVAEFCSDADLDDYFGSYSHTFHRRRQFEALKVWAEMMAGAPVA